MKRIPLTALLISVLSSAGCQHLESRKLPEVPRVAVDADASGEQKLMAQMMSQLAVEDAGSFRK